MRRKTKRLLIEFLFVVGLIAVLTAFMIPKFLKAQNAINPRNFPDPVFRQIVKQAAGVQNDEKVSKNQLAKIQILNVRPGRGKSPFSIAAKDLTGIEYFPNLLELDCRKNQITKLDLSRNPTLNVLKCDNNQIAKLDLSRHPFLNHVSCRHNRLIRLDVSGAARLQHLDCAYNQISELEVSLNLELTHFDVSHNQLTQMPDLRNHKKLKSVDVEYNNFGPDDLVNITPLLGRFPGQWAVLGDKVRYGLFYSSQNHCNLSDFEKEAR